ncbi:golgin subfamily A member 6-like protein 6 [Palaemon carinicauda]|uniref:golgin subfamily A member 6-like protein 6 n=1 Tax=Palaemon carinicauda TaxID=392227 RepID=UPI0035B59A78
MKEKPEEIEGIKVTDSIKYLGIEIEGKRNMFKKQKKKMMEKAEKLANLTYSIIAKSCHKILIGKTYWKNVALPGILYGTAVMNITESEIKRLQQIENGVGRKILGAPSYAAVATLRGEIGMSEMKTRIAGGRLRFVKGIEEGRNDLLKTILEEMKENENNRWMKETKKWIKDMEMNDRTFRRMGREELKAKIREVDGKKWRDEIKEKNSLEIYEQEKGQIGEEMFYDNKPNSIIMYRARANCLKLNDRKRHEAGGRVECKLCGAVNEDLAHFILECPDLSDERRKIVELQQPYEEEKKKIIGNVLFKKEGIEKRKEYIYQMWKKRESYITQGYA